MKQESTPSDQPLGHPVPNWHPPALPAQETMHGIYCRLEPLDPGRHAGELFAANALDTSGRGWTYLPYGPFASADAYRRWIKTDCGKPDPLFFAIIGVNTGKAVGVASYLRINPDAGSIEVGHLRYSPLLQRTPAGTEAMFLMMANAFTLGYRRYEWKCDALNAPSRAAAQRLGFTFEGVFRQANIVKGRNRDTAWYSVIASEWPALQTAFARWLDPANFDADRHQRERLAEMMPPG